MQELVPPPIVRARVPAAAAALPLVACLLGPLRLACGGRTVRLRSRKAAALLGYLLLGEAGEETRERIVGLFWSESEEEKARASLRQVLHDLRQALDAAGCQALGTHRATISIDRGQVSLDAADILREAEALRVHPALLDTPRLGERLLEGLEDVDPAFHVWLTATREAWHRKLMRLLERGLRQPDLAVPERTRFAQAIVQLEPTQEEAARWLMRASAEAGDVVGALRRYEQLWTLLDEEYETEPAAATQQLVADIKLGKLGPAAAPAEAPRPAAAPPAEAAGPARIALLAEPFAMNGIGPDQSHLVQGFRHDLVARLVRFREWFVVDGPAMPPSGQTRARVSGRYRITTTAYQAGDRISMVLTLADIDSGILAWSERFDLRLDTWFESQQRIVRRIATALNLQISGERLARIATEPDVSLEEHDRWLRAQSFILKFSNADWDRTRRLLVETVARSPGFAPAHSSLAQLDNCECFMRPGVRRTRAREASALQHAWRAVQLDPTDSRSHLCLGWAFAMAGRYEQADSHMQLALDLNPDDSWTLISVAMFFGFSGEHARARELAEQSLATTLTPGPSHWAYGGTIAFLRGDDAAAVPSCDLCGDVIITMPAWRAAALAQLGRLEEARAGAQGFLEHVRSRWCVEEPPTDAAITRWLLHQYPLRRRADWERLRDGVAAAGLPVAGAAFGDW